MLLDLALRNLWRNRRRTLLTLSAMVLSSALLILALGVFSGMFRDMLASATEQYHGHLVLSLAAYQEDRDLFAHFDATSPALQTMRDDPEVVGLSPRLRAFGLLSGGEKTQPSELLGVDPAQERQVTSLARQLTAGTFPASTNGHWIVLGAGLARRLGVGLGDELVFVTQAADGSIGNDLLQVVALFGTGATRDNSLALVSLSWLQGLMALPGEIHEAALRVRHPLEAAALAARLGAKLPPQLQLLDWGRLLPQMREAIASYDVSRLILSIILYLATGLGILNTFFMAVLERTREFGLLMALGMRPATIRLLVLLEALCSGLLALLLGVTVGLLLTLYMQRVGIDLSGVLSPITYAGGTIPPRLGAAMELRNVLVPAWMLLLVCLLAGFLPANRAAKLDPAAALREL